jgi:hypothetical protein
MPSATSPVGTIEIPLAAGASGATAADPIVDGVIDYVAWVLNSALNARLANWPSYGGKFSQAVPTANRFAWNPLEPQGHMAKLPVPGLWIWWHGRDTHGEHTLLQRKRTRDLRMLWVIPERPALSELERRAGLLSIASAALHRAGHWQRHPSYSYGSSAAGTPLYQTLADIGLLWFELLGCETLRFGIGAGQPGVPVPKERKPGRDYPALAAVWRIEELVGAKVMQNPDDLNRDHQVTIEATDGDEPVEIMQGIVGAPDGSEDL